MTSTPKKSIAILLGIIAPPLAFMYIAQGQWAVAYLVMALVVGTVGELFLHDSALAVVVQIAFFALCVSHTLRLLKHYPEGQPRPGYSRWYGLLGTAAATLAVVVGLRAFVAEPFRAPSTSMVPGIPLHSHFIVQKWGYGHYSAYGLPLLQRPAATPLKRGDIIVFDFPPDPSLTYVKRLIGLPGDTIVYRDKQLTINGIPVAQQAGPTVMNPRTFAMQPSFTETLEGTAYTILLDEAAPAASPTTPTTPTFPASDQCTFDPRGFTCHVPAGHYFAMGDNRDNSYDSRMWGFIPANHVMGKVVYVVG